MVNIFRAQHEVRFRLNKLNSNHKLDLPNAYIDDMLYEALLDYIEIFYSGNNRKAYNLGFEVTQQRIDMLSNFVVPFTITTSIETAELGYKKYEFNLSKNYLHHVRSLVTTSCGDKSIAIRQHDDINNLLTDAYEHPNANWNRIIGTIKKSTTDNNTSIFVYSDKTVTKIYGEYLKRPQKPFSGNYDTLEYLNGDTTYPNSLSSIQHLDIQEQFADIVYDITVQNISGIISDYNHNQYLQQKVITTN